MWNNAGLCPNSFMNANVLKLPFFSCAPVGADQTSYLPLQTLSFFRLISQGYGAAVTGLAEKWA